MLVSVIIPVYNSAHFIADTLDSVFRQNVRVETIVVNDGSTDGIHEVLSPYRSDIMLIDQPNLGLSAARNAGIRCASGEFLLFLDADDILGDDVVSQQIKAIELAKGVGVPVCRTHFFSKLNDQRMPVKTGEWRRFPQYLDIHLCHFNIAPPLAFLVRRDIALCAGGFDEKLGACEDHDFWLRVQELGHSPFPGGESPVWYRRHSNSMSSNIHRQRCFDREMHLRIDKLLQDRRAGFNNMYATRLLACCSGMLLTILRLDGKESVPLIEPSLKLLSVIQYEPKIDSSLYDYFLARCLMLITKLRNVPLLKSHMVIVKACCESANRSSWLDMSDSIFEKTVVGLGEDLYAHSD